MKKITARKILFSAVAASLTFLSFASSASAATFKQVSTSLADPASNASTVYTIDFNTGSGASVDEIDLVFSTLVTGGSTPTNMNIGSASIGSLSSNLGAQGNWTITNTQGSRTIKLTTSSAVNLASNATVALSLGSIVSPAIGDCNGGTVSASSDTCYVLITTKYTNSTVDTGAASFTVTATTTATATVDPSLTFTVAGVAATTATNGVTTTQASTYNTLPFGHFQATSSQIVAQALSVATNAQNGYYVYAAMTGVMTGTYGSTISPFNLSTAWDTPIAWTAPTGVTSGNGYNAFIGANTSDTRIGSGWASASAKFSAINTTFNPVEFTNAPDNGTSVYVTYKMQTSVYQQADTYTGTLKYSVVPTY